VKSHRSERFDKAFERLPEQVKRQVREAYRLFARNPYRPGLRFKRVHPNEPI
jgi:hypothetical protein